MNLRSQFALFFFDYTPYMYMYSTEVLQFICAYKEKQSASICKQQLLTHGKFYKHHAIFTFHLHCFALFFLFFFCYYHFFLHCFCFISPGSYTLDVNLALQENPFQYIRITHGIVLSSRERFRPSTPMYISAFSLPDGKIKAVIELS